MVENMIMDSKEQISAMKGKGQRTETSTKSFAMSDDDFINSLMGKK